MPKNQKRYDCIIVGSGPGGSPLAWKLASSGMDVLILEAGVRYDPLKDYPLDKDDWEIKGFPYKTRMQNAFGDEQELDPKYESLKSWNKSNGDLNRKDQRRYLSYQQVLGVGGTTLHFQGEAHRLSEDAFKMKSLYGVAVDWPITYKDLEPYYAEAEKIIGVAGPKSVPFRPRSSPFPLKPHKFTYASEKIKKACSTMDIELDHNPVAILSELYRDTPSCNYCNGCVYGCPRRDKGSVDVTFVPLAEDTGKCEFVTEAFVTRLEVEKTAKGKSVKGVEYYDKDGKKNFVEADYIALACGAVQTPRLLLNSEITGNGIVGKNFMETVFYDITAFHPDRLDRYRGIPIDGIVWKWNKPDPKKLGFAGGLRLYTTSGGASGPVSYAQRFIEGWGEDLVKGVEKWFGHAISMGGLAEFLPNEKSFVTVDDKMKDRFGFPVAKIQSYLGDAELKSLQFMAKKCKEILEATGAKDFVEQISAYDLFLATHVFGTCRMGNDPETSFVNSSLRCHDIPNLLVTDASVFPTSGGGEAPSLTIEALSLRAGDKLIESLKKG